MGAPGALGDMTLDMSLKALRQLAVDVGEPQMVYVP
jgi:hypothetical protein